MTIAMLTVGCTPVEQQEEKPTYFDYGTSTYSLSITNDDYEFHGVTFWLPDMLEGRENNDKYVEFWGENGLKERQVYYYDRSYYNSGSMIFNQSYNETHTITNVSEIAAENITFVNGKDQLLQGEILVHKWDYINMCLGFSGLYVSGYMLDNTVIVSDNVLSKYIMTLSTHGNICNFGLAADYYNLAGDGSSLIRYKDDIIIEIGDGTSTGPKAEYKVAGYYINRTDAEFLARTYTMDRFTSVSQLGVFGNVPMTKTENAIAKEIKSITRPLYVCNE